MPKPVRKVILERLIPVCWNMDMNEKIGNKPLRFTFFPKWVISRNHLKEFEIAAPSELFDFPPSDLDFSLYVEGEIPDTTQLPTVGNVIIKKAELIFVAGDLEIVRLPADHLAEGWSDYIKSELLQPSRG